MRTVTWASSTNRVIVATRIVASPPRACCSRPKVAMTKPKVPLHKSSSLGSTWSNPSSSASGAITLANSSAAEKIGSLPGQMP